MTATTGTAATPTSLPARLWRSFVAVLGAPVRVCRRRIYAQLITSHLLVALLLAILLTVSAFGLFLEVIIPSAAPPLVSAAGVTEQVRMRSADPGATGEHVGQTLSRMLAAGQPDELPLPIPSTQGDLAILVAPDGPVLSSLAPSAAPTGQRLDSTRWPCSSSRCRRWSSPRRSAPGGPEGSPVGWSPSRQQIGSGAPSSPTSPTSCAPRSRSSRQTSSACSRRLGMAPPRHRRSCLQSSARRPPWHA